MPRFSRVSFLCLYRACLVHRRNMWCSFCDNNDISQSSIVWANSKILLATSLFSELLHMERISCVLLVVGFATKHFGLISRKILFSFVSLSSLSSSKFESYYRKMYKILEKDCECMRREQKSCWEFFKFIFFPFLPIRNGDDDDNDDFLCFSLLASLLPLENILCCMLISTPAQNEFYNFQKNYCT